MAFRENLVSVSMITYKHAHLIRSAIEGVLSQDCSFEVELVIGDDDSPDNTEEVIQSFSGHPRFHWIKYLKHRPNLGVIENLNATLAACMGKYVAFCEGDDYWIDAHKLQKQFDFLEQHPDYVLTFTSRRIEEADGVMKDSLVTAQDWDKEAIYNHGTVFPLQTVMGRNFGSELIGFLRKFPNSFGADKHIGYFYTLKGKVRSLPDISAVYRHNGEGAWSRFGREEKMFLHIDESLKFIDAIERHKLDPSVSKHSLTLRLFRRILRAELGSRDMVRKLISRYSIPKTAFYSALFDRIKARIGHIIRR